jgi:isopenicillin N synthase-like dioxygenase
MRSVRYVRPSFDPATVDGPVLGMGAHTDYGICTVLSADPVPGLELFGDDGEWHAVTPRPDAIVVNIGDLLALSTNDVWRSTIHRVVPPTVAQDGRVIRRSMPFFFDGDYDAVIECLPTCVSEERPARYAPVRAEDHLMAKLMGPRTLQASEETADTVGARRSEGLMAGDGR